ncbi:unnamed protein product [Lepeophtheirus salmonis]|uniref:(salmon louse) hypothetical protein n=1 Tax=Lepeophtheirus salmonis TaxID=72036 RepID=A0A7R8CZL1_LEPSM|nr:unnamed protein product [Lepeophtheirus salmonis]CAF2976906.1 unnamed protein product [Lepeophtheirus salmonis]
MIYIIMPWSKVLAFCILSNLIQLSYPQLFGWNEERQNRRLFEEVDEDGLNESNSIESTSSKPVLNIGDKDSPYALINTFFIDRETEHERRKDLFAIQHARGEVPDPPKGIKPEEVWLSDGNLLVLKGGTPDDNVPPNQWRPLDDFVAPYREPKLPPPDFVPSDIGVGVPLEDEESNSYTTESTLTTTTSSPKSKDKFSFSAVATHLPILLRWKDSKSSSENNEIDDSIILRNKGITRRNGERYVTFFRGATRGAQSWGYSYRY